MDNATSVVSVYNKKIANSSNIPESRCNCRSNQDCSLHSKGLKH